VKAQDYLLAGPPFTLEDVQRAADGWGCNCGPSAIAAVVRIPLEDLRSHLGDFERKRYTNPTLMFAILQSLGVRWQNVQGKAWPEYGLVRVQWHGPWMAAGVPIKARYRQTHWIGSRHHGTTAEIFDVNCMCVGGWVSRDEWARQVAPWIVRECVPRGTGEWSLTHSLEVISGVRNA
jgi:hypothetical protein